MRLAKLNNPDCGFDAIIMAIVGWQRIGEENVVTEALDPTVILPGCCQGTIAMECQSTNSEMVNLLSRISCANTACASLVERLILRSNWFAIYQ